MRVRLKLKTVFVFYFMVSLLGLMYALMQLGKSYLCCKCKFVSCVKCHGYYVRFSAGQRCDCRDNAFSKDQQISQLRGELQKLQEHIKTSELSKISKPEVPAIYVITPTYARYGVSIKIIVQ